MPVEEHIKRKRLADDKHTKHDVFAEPSVAVILLVMFLVFIFFFGGLAFKSEWVAVIFTF